MSIKIIILTNILCFSVFLNANILPITKIKKGCENGVAKDCSLLAFYLELDSILNNDYNKTIYYYKKACRLDYKECGGLAGLYATGKGVNRDIQKSFTLYNKACENGSMSSCLQIGMMYQEGIFVKVDYKKSLNLFKKVCLSNSPSKFDGCYLLGNLYKNGFGVHKNINYAIKYFKEVCDKGKGTTKSFGCDEIKKINNSSKTR